MKRINPRKIQIGEYNIQEFISSKTKLIKIRTQMDNDRIHGRIIYVESKRNSSSFEIGKFGYVYYKSSDSLDVVFYLLTKEEVYTYVI